MFRLWLVALALAGDPVRASSPSSAPAAPTEDRPPPGFVDLAALAPRIAVDMRYAGSQNFVGRPIRGYTAPRCLLARPAAVALARVAVDLERRGLGLLMLDCYRPQRAVADFAAWASDPDLSTQARHYPAIPKSQLFGRGYIASRSGHSRGSTVDLTLIRRAPGARAPFTEPSDCRTGGGGGRLDIDMGTTFDCFDERAHTDYPGLQPAVRRHRQILQRAMRRRGFAPYAKEWWHFTLIAEPFPNHYFDFEVR